MQKAYILVGIPGIGKSTKRAELLKNNDNIITASADDVRQELFGDAAIQGDFAAIFAEVNKRADEALKIGKDVIFDNTNITKFARKSAINIAKNNGAAVVAIVFENNLTAALEGNAKRDRHVPEYVIKNMSERFEDPSLEEGIDEIVRVIRH